MRQTRHFTLSARSLPQSHSLPSLNPREASTLASSGTEHSPRPFFSARRSHSELTAGRPKRLSRRERAALERRLSDADTHAWLRTHSTVALPRYEMPKSKKRALRECFDLLDADGGGTIDLSEISLVMRALGFSPAAIKQAIKLGDRDGDGELSFDEFVALVTQSGGASGGGGGDADSFPFALVANSHRLTTLVDSYDPAVLAAADAKNDRRARAARPAAPAEPSRQPRARRAPSMRVAAPGGGDDEAFAKRNRGRRVGMSSTKRAPGADAPLALPRVRGAAPAHPIDGMWLLSRNSVVAAVLSGAGA